MNPFDRGLVLWLNGLSGNVEIFDDLMRFVASDYLMPLAFSVSIFALWFSGKGIEQRTKYQFATLVGASSIGLSNAAVALVNAMWSRPRPFVDLEEINLLFYRATDPSFPANPVVVGFAAASAAWMANRKFGYWLMAAALLYGFSRVYAGVFYPTDIAGGAALGIIVTWGTVYLHRFFQPVTGLFIRLTRGLAIG